MLKKIYSDPFEVLYHIYTLCGLKHSEPLMEKESAEYSACTFHLDNSIIQFRIANTTPIKSGQFVTFWKRMGTSSIQPYDFNDPFDFLVISTRKENQVGQFIFPKNILAKQGVLSINGKGGKRAMRVYSEWDTALNHQAHCPSRCVARTIDFTLKNKD